MKKLITLLIILIAFCELKAQNKQYEFIVEKQDVGVDIIIDEYFVVGWKRELKFTTKNKNKKYRFTFTHGTIEQKDKLIYVVPNKTGEGIIKVYEVVGKENKLIKEITIDIYEAFMNYFGDKKVNNIDEINDTTTLNQPFTIKLKNETKELVFPIESFQISWICNEMISQIKISGNIINKKLLNSFYKDCNPVKLFIENISYKDEKGNLRRRPPLILNISVPKKDE